jgi:hypothetical protein
MRLRRRPVGATHTPYSDHIDRNRGILREDWTWSGKRQCRNRNSSYHAIKSGCPLQHHYKSGRSVTADRAPLKRDPRGLSRLTFATKSANRRHRTCGELRRNSHTRMKSRG